MGSLNRLALLQHAEGCLQRQAFMQARLSAEALLRTDNNDAEGWFILARIDLSHGRHDGAVKHLQKCLARHPRELKFLVSLGVAYSAGGQHDLAVNTYTKALKVDPDYHRALAGLIEACEKQGDIEKAKQALEPIVARCATDPFLGRAFALVALAENRPQDAVDMLVRNAAAGMPRTGYYLLGKAYERLGDFDKALEAYALANHTDEPVFDIEEHIAYIYRFVSVFTPEALARLPRSKVDSSPAVFVTGRPRSGTTLVSKIIGAHPQAVDVGEAATLNDMVTELGVLIGSDAPYPQTVLDVNQNDVNMLGQRYIDGVITEAGRRMPRIVDKGLANPFHMGLIELILPQARVIYCRRDAVDNCMACYTEPLVGMHAYASDLRTLGLTHRLHERLWRHWQSVLTAPILEVNYEDVVADQEGQTRRIIEFLGLPWDDACLKFYESEKGVLRRSAAHTLSYSQVRKPIYRTSVNRSAKFEKHLAPLLEALDEGQRRWGGDMCIAGCSADASDQVVR